MNLEENAHIPGAGYTLIGHIPRIPEGLPNPTAWRHTTTTGISKHHKRALYGV